MHLEDGKACEGCGRVVNFRPGSINRGMALTAQRMLGWHEQHGFSGHVHVLRDLTDNEYRDFTTLKHWGLIEPNDEPGYWRLTPAGVAWARAEIGVPPFIVTFNDALVEDVTDAKNAGQPLVYVGDV